MKKPGTVISVCITCVFAAFVFGFFFGRQAGYVPVRMTVIPAATAAASPSQPQSTAAAGTDAPVQTAGAETATQFAVVFPININAATAAELQALPGIGPVLAQRIVDYRSVNGSFPAPEALTNVSGIGEKRLESILHLITTGG